MSFTLELWDVTRPGLNGAQAPTSLATAVQVRGIVQRDLEAMCAAVGTPLPTSGPVSDELPEACVFSQRLTAPALLDGALGSLGGCFAWRVPLFGLLRWLQASHVRPLRAALSADAAAALEYAQAMLDVDDLDEVLRALERANVLAPTAWDVWALLAVVQLTVGSTAEDAASAASAATRALDMLPAALRPESEGFLLACAAEADAARGAWSAALARADRWRACGDTNPWLWYAMLRWRLLRTPWRELLPEIVTAVGSTPALAWRLWSDPLLANWWADGDAFRAALTETLARAVQDAAHGWPRDDTAWRLWREVEHAAVGPLTLVEDLARLRAAAVAAQACGGDRGGDGATPMPQELQVAIQRIQQVPVPVPCRIPRALAGGFGTVLRGGTASDLARIERWLQLGIVTEAWREARAVQRVLTPTTASAMQEYAALLAHSQFALLQYLLGRERSGRGAAPIGLERAARMAAEVSDALLAMGQVRDGTRAGPAIEKAVRILHSLQGEWETARAGVVDCSLVVPVPELFVGAGDWMAVELYVADAHGVPVGGIPVHWSVHGDGLRPRWPYSALAPGFSVSFITGKVLVAVEADPSRRSTDTSVGWISVGLAPGREDVRIPVSILAAPLDAVA
ncbi:MAG: hypothetical protein ACYC5V_04680 [Gemmatimonadaceae bacterium]